MPEQFDARIILEGLCIMDWDTRMSEERAAPVSSMRDGRGNGQGRA